MNTVPEVEASHLHTLPPEITEGFGEAGLLVLRNAIHPSELEHLRSETADLVERAVDEDPELEVDVRRSRHELTGQTVPFRIEYVVDKSPAARALAGHPLLLRTVERLQGPSFIPTWDSMVFKLTGSGAAIPWHRDAAVYEHIDDAPPVFNVDIYLDAADQTNCLWGFPGSHRWGAEEASETIEGLNHGDDFQTDGATPLPMQPGDVLLHDVKTVHGSPPARSDLRRVIYYEYRPAPLELAAGPHTPEYIPLKQQVLLECLRAREAADYTRDPEPFLYRPDGPFAVSSARSPTTLRVPHGEHWRNHG